MGVHNKEAGEEGTKLREVYIMPMSVLLTLLLPHVESEPTKTYIMEEVCTPLWTPGKPKVV